MLEKPRGGTQRESIGLARAKSRDSHPSSAANGYVTLNLKACPGGNSLTAGESPKSKCERRLGDSKSCGVFKTTPSRNMASLVLSVQRRKRTPEVCEGAPSSHATSSCIISAICSPFFLSSFLIVITFIYSGGGGRACMPQYTHRGPRAFQESPSFFHVGPLQIKLRSLCLVASTLTH